MKGGRRLFSFKKVSCAMMVHALTSLRKISFKNMINVSHRNIKFAENNV
jgi:hypothetical protein